MLKHDKVYVAICEAWHPSAILWQTGEQQDRKHG
jgi:hypothetical protein